jgi:transcriptional regulator with XRE-family HTH domain
MSLHSHDELRLKLRDRAHRAAFVASRINNFLAFQIRALRQKKKWSQAQLAKKLETSQNAVSRMENPSYGKHSITTLKRLGEIFDVGIVVWFVPFSELINRAVNLSTENVIVPSFEEEFGVTEEDARSIEKEIERKQQKQRAQIQIALANPPQRPAMRGLQLQNYVIHRDLKPANISLGHSEVFQGKSLGEEPAQMKALRKSKQTPTRDLPKPINLASGTLRLPIAAHT